MTHPYSIFIWQTARRGGGTWIEPLQAYSQEYALYAANLIHQDTKSVIKVVRYGLIIAAYPDKDRVERIERQVRLPGAPASWRASPDELSLLVFLLARGSTVAPGSRCAECG